MAADRNGARAGRPVNRRHLLGSLAGLAVAGTSACGRAADPSGRFEITLSEAEWRQRLTPAQFQVLRGHGTERAGSSPLDREKRRGVFHCAGCDLPLFASQAKFDSGTGWPSFTRPLPGAIGTRADRSFFMTRTEVHCRRCGGHLGHVFDDGPPPTGLRYCMNGVAMNFVPAAEAG
jgi:peptide-methionine (R)-S-oxide reductase